MCVYLSRKTFVLPFSSLSGGLAMINSHSSANRFNVEEMRGVRITNTSQSAVVCMLLVNACHLRCILMIFQFVYATSLCARREVKSRNLYCMCIESGNKKGLTEIHPHPYTLTYMALAILPLGEGVVSTHSIHIVCRKSSGFCYCCCCCQLLYYDVCENKKSI